MISIKVPPLGESIVEATVARWLKKEGEAVAAGDTLVELETDKVTVEVPRSKAACSRGRRSTKATSWRSTTSSARSTRRGGCGARRGASAGAPAGRRRTGSRARHQRAAAAPRRAGRRRGRREGIARRAARRRRGWRRPRQRHGNRPRRRGQQARRHRAGAARAAQGAGASAARRRSRRTPGRSARPRRATPRPPAGTRETREKMSTRRKRIAEHLLEAQHATAHLTTFNEIDMSAVSALRERIKERVEKEHGVKLTFMPFFVKAACRRSKRIPVVNAQIDGDSIVYKHYVNMGIAVASDAGLVVPNIKDADRKGMLEVARDIVDVAKRARDGKLAMDDLTGGTFTITNGGVFGSLVSTPIINYPQVGILGLHKIQDRPVAVDGKVEIRPMMYVALSYDHRIIDGQQAVLFLVRVKELMEDPAAMLID